MILCLRKNHQKENKFYHDYRGKNPLRLWVSFNFSKKKFDNILSYLPKISLSWKFVNQVKSFENYCAELKTGIELAFLICKLI